ncbi:MAG: glycoside hydrolase family 3 C-terminal domain-containing protein, partial [Bacteroidales bacterium]|nr:glycoside hydrolase family 3 C-terminal domain-containing protein [Bacteroidales bacterium]
VRRVLRMKYMIGLIQNPYPDCSDFDIVGKDEYKQTAVETTRESIVLLKNETSILPIINPDRIVLAGPFIHLKHPLCGSWTFTWQGDDEKGYPDEMKTIWDAFQDEFSSSHIDSARASNLSQKADNADLIILTIGEHAYTEYRGNRPTLQADKSQRELMHEAIATGKPVVIVLIGGRPLVIDEEIVEKAAAIIWAGLPGEYGARAICEIISGKINPNGKLPFSYPAHLNYHVPYNHKPAELWSSQKTLKPYLYGFGYGLSYSSFEYTNLEIDNAVLSDNEEVTATVTVTNTGAISGKEAVLWFITDEYGLITRPVKELRFFEKQELKPGESKTFSFTIVPEIDLAYPDEVGNNVLEEGTFIISVGNQEIQFDLSENNQ